MRVDELARRFGDRIQIEWKAFLLRPEMKERDQEEFVAYTQSWLRPASLEPEADFRTWATTNPAPMGSLPAHIAAKAMAGFAPDAADAFHHRLLSAYFTENRTISDWSVLGEVAEEVGVDRHDFVSVAREQERSLATVVIDEHNSAIQSGVTAVPTIVLDDVLPVQGAQDVATYETWINRLIDRRHSEA